MRMVMSAPMKPAYPPTSKKKIRWRPGTVLVLSFQNKDSTSAAEEEGGATLDSVAVDQRQEPTAEHAPGPGVRARCRRITAVASLNLPDEILVWEISVRLPAKDILHCRSVCRSWRHLTTAADFLLAHHRHQPSLPILTVSGSASTVHDLPILERCGPLLGFDNYLRFKIHSSCDGLLLLTLFDGRLIICNPTTRLCAPLRGVTDNRLINVVAMYLHCPSDEYRILYRIGRYVGASYYILAVQRGGSSTRCIVGVLSGSPGMKKDTTFYETTPTDDVASPVVFRNCLHWDPGCLRNDGSIVVFDTVVESFRIMRPPTGATRFGTRVCDMEGSMGFSCFDDGRTVVKIWLLEDYEREVWSFKYHVELQVERLCTLVDTQHLVLSHDGDVLVYNHSKGYMFRCDNTGKLIEEFQCDPRSLSIVGHRLRESLVKHDIFSRRGSACARQPSLFCRI